MDHKIRIKIGALEIEYEGTEAYLKSELPSLIDKLVAINIPVNKGAGEENSEDKTNHSEKESNSPIEMSTNTIAAKLNVKSGTELIIAACAQFAFVRQRETFARKDILDEMKSASNYYKETYRKNLSNALKTLVNNGKLIERSKDTYALPATQKNLIKPKLSGN